MSTVVGRDKDYPNEQHMSLDSYTTQRLKLRLKKYFGDNFFLHQPYDRTISELLYSSAISDIPSICHQLCLQVQRRCNTERMSCEQPSVEILECSDTVQLTCQWYSYCTVLSNSSNQRLITDGRGISI